MFSYLVIFNFLIFIFGLVIGSFLNCVIYRLALQNFSKKNLGGREKGESFLKGRSYCPQCRHQLTWRDLIPILGFFILKGKCRYCHQKISWQYPLVELFTAFIFLFFFIAHSTNYTMVYFLLISCFLIIIFVYDLKHYIIPDKVVYPAIGITFIYQLFRSLEFVNWSLFGIWNLEFGILKPILSATLASVFFLLIVLVSCGKWMGIGDIKLAFLMGLILGFPNILVALFLAFFLGAIIGLGLIISGRKTLKSEIPFGPFLITGTFIGLFCGGQIINWYLSFLI